MGTDAATMMDEINRAAWQTRASVRSFARLEGFTDNGERAAFAAIAHQVRDEPILDLGVGGGRTVPLLRSLSDDYTAIDYTPELVTACRRKHPDARILHGDARDLSCFPSEMFKLVVFSFNGIDAVNPADRQKVLREVHRVLRRDGIFLFSAHNKRGPGHGEPLSFGLAAMRNPFKLLASALRALKDAPRTARNYVRYSRLNEDHHGHSIMNAAAHNHGLLIHYVTLEQQCQQLEQLGFLPAPDIYENVAGRRVESGSDTSRAWWLHFVARKR